MKSILIIGAGRSSTTLINYLIKAAEDNFWSVVVADSDLNIALNKTAHSSVATGVELDVNDEVKRQALIKDKDVILSLTCFPASNCSKGLPIVFKTLGNGFLSK
jgi:saccharopine dehydrogenase-like NADP-dependent oxidoreductase